MADTTISIRVNEEIQDKFKELSQMSEFKNNGEFFNYLITQYSIEKTKEEVLILSPAITSINDLMLRINNILVGAGEQIRSKEESYNIKLDEQKNSFNETLKELQEQISSLKENKNKYKNQLELTIKSNEQYKKRVDETENIIKDKIEIIEELKNKNSQLSNELSEYTKAKMENKELKEELSSYQKNVSVMADEINEVKKTLTMLTEAHERKISILEREFEIEKQNSIIELNKQNNIELDNIKSKYDNKIMELLKMQINSKN